MSSRVNHDVEALIEELRTWRPTRAEGTLAQERIDQLDQAISSTDPNSDIYGRGIARLRALCRRTGCLPTSCFLEEEIELESNHPLHRTALSDVYQGRRGTLLVALKSLRVHGDDKDKVEKSFRNEVLAWKCLRHPHIVPFLGISNVLPVCLVSEWMAHGSINSFLRVNPSEDRLKYAKDVLNGLCYMHSHNIVHGDLKGANILVDEARNARVADFGLTALLQSTCTMTATTSTRGTLRWMSPELLDDRLAPGSGGPTIASDMYAVAMVLWEIFTGRIPFSEVAADFRVLMDVLSGLRPMRPADGEIQGLTDVVWAAMQHCWEMSPDARPSCTDVVRQLGGLTSDIAPSRAPNVDDDQDVYLSGVYEIANIRRPEVLDLGQWDNTIGWWDPHASDNQRWEVDEDPHGLGYALRSSASGEYLAGNTLLSPTLWVQTEPFHWVIRFASGAYTILLPTELNTVALTLPTYSAGGLRSYNPTNPNQQWRFRKEAEHPGDLEGIYEFVNLESGTALELPAVTTLATPPESAARRFWELYRTRRGQSIRSVANGEYLNVLGPKPIVNGMRLRTITQRTSWRLEPVPGPEPSDIYRICWPDKLHAIGTSAAPLHRAAQLFMHTTSGNAQMFLASLDGAHLHWKLVPHEGGGGDS